MTTARFATSATALLALLGVVLPGAIPPGDYNCKTYGTYANVGMLRIYGDGTSSGMTRDGSGPKHRYAYDAATGNIKWDGGLRIFSWTVESAIYAPESGGKPNINLHYRRVAGGNLSSMSCTRT